MNNNKILKIKFGDKIIKNNEKLKLDEVINKPEIFVKLNKNNELNQNINYYTFMILDPDAPIGIWIHQIYYNIIFNKPNLNQFNNKFYHKILNYKKLYEYTNPTPPKGTGIHRYYCILFKQNNELNFNINFNNKNIQKRGFKEFKEILELMVVKLVPIDYLYFRCEYNN